MDKFMKIAEEYFYYHNKVSLIETKIYYIVINNIGIPCEDITMDHYDCSIEFIGVPNGLKLTEIQNEAIKDLGFQRYWLNHFDGTETYKIFI